MVNFLFRQKVGLDTDPPVFTVSSILNAKKPIDNKPKLVPELAMATIPAVEAAAVLIPSATPWVEKGWNWVCDTANDVANGASALLKDAGEVANGIYNDVTTGIQNATNAAGKFISGVCDDVGA